VFNIDREPLSRLVRTADVSDLFTFYDLTKTVEINVGTDEWRRSLRIYFQKGLRLELNDAKVPIEGYPQVFDRSLYLSHIAELNIGLSHMGLANYLGSSERRLWRDFMDLTGLKTTL
jgi:hypothetical protein